MDPLIDAHRLNEIKSFMHVDHNDDDDLIRADAEMAREYLADLGITDTDTVKHRYWAAVKRITMYWYDMPADGGDRYALPQGVRRLINALKGKEESGYV